MKKYMILLILPLIVFTFGCSGEEAPAVSSHGSDEIQRQELDAQREAPASSGVEMSRIPTPAGRENSPEGEAVYLFPQRPGFPDGANSPLAFKPEYAVISLKYLPAKKASEILGRLMPESVFIEGERASMLIVKGKIEDIHEVKKLIKSIDKPTPQIMIESRVVEISESGLKTLGFTWGSSAGNLKMTINTADGKIDSENISAVLSALASKGEAHLIANPRISTLDNSEANVNIGSKIPYAVPVSSTSSATQWAVQYIDAGVSLKITPRLGNDRHISVSIHPEVSSISEWRTTAAGEFPVISTRNADAMVRVKDGETIVIGGLIDESDRENISKIPIAGDIPIVKELFTKKTTEKTKTEVIFMITPHVM